MTPARDRPVPDRTRHPSETARRRGRALEAFLSQQILALHRSGTSARRRLDALAPPPQPRELPS